MPSRLLDLQALRGVACLLVLLFHASEWERQLGGEIDCHLLYPFQFFGYAGVDLFFVLSGFIITWAHLEKVGRPTELLSYAARRFWRIYPLYWACWLLVILRPVFEAGSAAPSFAWAIRCLFLLPEQGNEAFPQGSLQAGNVCFPQSWTLVYEVMFYLLFADFFLLPRRWFLPGLVGWFLAAAVFALSGWPNLGFLAGLPLQPLVLEFLLGCFAAIALSRGIRIPPRWCLVVGVVWFAAGGCLHYAGLTAGSLDPRHRVATFGVAAALLIYGFTARERATAPCTPRWLQAIGHASYSIYLTHVVVLAGVFKATTGMSHHLLPHFAWLGLMTSVPLTTGYVLHVCVERPLLTRRRREPSRELCTAVWE
jgi:peptidoglycan/LPS O-acetylase OafA/YrhL